MAKRNATTATPQAGSTGESMENRMLAFAEQIGRIAGTMQAKAEGWLDREALNKQIATIRDSATELLRQIGAPVASDEKRSTGSRSTNGAARNAGSGRTAANQKRQGGQPQKAGSRQSAAAPSARQGAGKQRQARSASGGGAAEKKSAVAGTAGRSGGAVDAPGKKHRGPMPSEGGATGRPRGDGARLAKLKTANMNRMQRRG